MNGFIFTQKRIFSSLFALSLLAVGGCANDAGDEVECPTCDNVTELLVGSKCVPIAEVEACGPDGHAHGSECHCFNGQETTAIGGADYCLQQGCASGTAPTEHEVDVDDEACEHFGDTPEAVTAVDAFDRFEEAHVELEVPADLTLPASGSAFVHFPGHETGHVLVYLDTADVFAGAFNKDHQALEVEHLGANSDCADDLVDAWEVHVVNDTGSVAPQIIELHAGTASSVRVVLVAEQE